MGAIIQFVIIPLAVALIIGAIFKSQMKSVAAAKEASHYVTEQGVKIEQRTDRYTHTTVDKTPIQKPKQ